MVIKAGRAAEKGAMLRPLSVVDLADHLAETRLVLDDARRRAEEIIGDAQREADRLRNECRQSAHDDGYREGLERGHAAGFESAKAEALRRFSAEQGDLAADLRRVIDEIDGQKNALSLSAQRHLLDFAIGLARKLTFSIGVSSTDSAVANMERALQIIGSKTDVTIRAHPRDIEALETFTAALSERIKSSDAVKLVADESIAPGGCVVRNERTEVDASLEAQTEELVTLLLGDTKRP